MKLNIGCGRDTKDGYVNLDRVKLKGVNVTHNLDSYPYPFKNNTFKEVLCYSILEHLNNPENTMKELHRISKPGATIKIIVPYWNSHLAWGDITHKRGFTLDTFLSLTKNDDRAYYFDFHYKIIRQKTIPSPIGKFLPEKLRILTSFFISNMIECLYVELRVQK